MASVKPTMNNTVGRSDGSVVVASWVLTSTNVDGLPIELPEFTNFTWQYEGTWGAATLTLQGSNSGNSYFSLTKVNTSGTAATATADGGVSTNEASRFVRPNLTTPGSGASVTVTLVANRATPLRT